MTRKEQENQRKMVSGISPSFITTPTNAGLHNESTTIFDSDEGLSNRSRKDFEASYTIAEQNPEFLRSQPLKKMASPITTHYHTKSSDYDEVNSLQFNQIPYM